MRWVRSALSTVLVIFGGSVGWGDALQAQSSFGISWHSIDLDGDFDGSRQLTFGQDVFTIPAVEQTAMLGVSIGAAGPRTGWDFRFVWGSPSYTGLVGDTVGLYRSFGVDAYFAPSLAGRVADLSPLLRVGAAYTTLRLPATVTSGGPPGDATFGGMSYEAGVGAILRLAAAISIRAEYSVRALAYGEVRGLGLDQKVDGGLDAGSAGLSVSASIALTRF